MSQEDLSLPQACLCPSCPHYPECLAASRKLIGNIQSQTQTVDFQTLKATADQIAKNLQTTDIIEQLFAYGGLLLGRQVKKWLEQNYVPRRRRK
jgi:hypothetical protein